MAKTFKDYEERFQRLKDEKVILPSEIWNLIYSSVEDSLSVIRLIVESHLERKEEVPFAETQLIYDNILDVFAVFRKVLKPQLIQNEDKRFIKIKQESRLVHKDVAALFNHYIGNDMQILCFIVGDCVDSKEPLNEENCKKVLEHIRDMEEFLQKLKISTESQADRIRNQLTLPMIFLKNLQNNGQGWDEAKLKASLACLEDIDRMVKDE
jgi:hypothetical protein